MAMARQADAMNKAEEAELVARERREAKENVVRVKEEGAKRVKTAREARREREALAKRAKLLKNFVGLNLGHAAMRPDFVDVTMT
ncbi:hypothetical protein B0A48_17292 [Cryoendolithus antarcticus]|uniref:Uncharacterized protein n=1 Tax=Cryoendolithus antarcticus TaxID=1507870 RepID=A0A1V8SBZ3_9PEZI|nr:hypothetical protein B0A48_17292 [Cryoendolithus antarcticus]